MNDFTADIVVVGGGPAGLTAALALASAGVETVLVAAPAPTDNRTTMLLTGALGVWERCRAALRCDDRDGFRPREEAINPRRGPKGRKPRGDRVSHSIAHRRIERNRQCTEWFPHKFEAASGVTNLQSWQSRAQSDACHRADIIGPEVVLLPTHQAAA